MSFITLTILQLTGILIMYIMFTVAVPAMVFHRCFSGKKLSVSIMAYITIGNFYIINLVYILQLLHISNVYTLSIFTLIPVAAAFYYFNLRDFPEVLIRVSGRIEKVANGSMGTKTFFSEIRKGLRNKVRGSLINSLRFIKRHFFECLIVIALTVATLFIYGMNGLHYYGYSFSDLPVHNYWINEMGNNNIFVAGIYPFGFHNVIYYFHIISGLDTYVLLRLFGIVQMLFIHLCLFVFLRSVCRTVYAPYAGLGIYILVNIFNAYCTSRFISALPQEFGMIFILPCIYFLFCFLEGEIKEKKVLVLAAMNLSLTITVHFYDTIILGICCVAIAIVFIRRFFKLKTILMLMAALFAALIIGVLPMLAAVAQGKQMQGSLSWGINVITGKKTTDNTQTDEEDMEDETSTEVETLNANQNTNGDYSDSNTDIQSTTDTNNVQQNEYISKVISAFNIGKSYSVRFYDSIDTVVQKYLMAVTTVWFTPVLLLGIFYTIVAGSIFVYLKDNDYGLRLIMIGLSVFFLLILLDAHSLSLPLLIDENRSRIFFAYFLTVALAMVVDSISFFISMRSERAGTKDFASFILMSLICLAAIDSFGFRHPHYVTDVNRLETNGAIVCLSSIIHENEKESWTIVSANDETGMIDKNGYHYETYTMLSYMKNISNISYFSIPTKYVYFYIEKKPLAYTEYYEGLGQEVSKDGAALNLPAAGGLRAYKGENRWIVMSKMYYWAETFQKLYPNEMTVYYEDSEFICYRLEQNQYSLFRLNIDTIE